jgi:hypothetical protein
MPVEYSPSWQIITNAKIPTSSGEPVTFRVPIGKLIYELAVQWGRIFVQWDGKEVALFSDSRGERLDYWSNRCLKIDEDSRKILLKGYEGPFDLKEVMKVYLRLQENFAGAGV